MRCKNCFRVVGHPSKKSKILQICGLCRRLYGYGILGGNMYGL